ncbi:hypothetical protein SDC9_92126 [bioreactor metagenome]|uniref:Uncharacterized protein n=1 Tax=bioreactor metagenome TaxID=1076179 RepID=A0A644ZWU9_9ZZZZ
MVFTILKIVFAGIGFVSDDFLNLHPVFYGLFHQAFQLGGICFLAGGNLDGGDQPLIGHGKMVFVAEETAVFTFMACLCLRVIAGLNVVDLVILQHFRYVIPQFPGSLAFQPLLKDFHQHFGITDFFLKFCGLRGLLRKILGQFRLRFVDFLPQRLR